MDDIKAAVDSGLPLSWAGIAALIVSALLTTLYLFDIIIKAYFPKKDLNVAELNKGVKDPNGYMTIPMIGLTAFSIVFGIWPAPLLKVFTLVANGLF